ncbi:MAG: hypothetical protein F4078_01220 [Acidimicrobiia bacterium]|nr:hypothetical protein [Acidimicrobiia bacterium]
MICDRYGIRTASGPRPAESCDKTEPCPCGSKRKFGECHAMA